MRSMEKAGALLSGSLDFSSISAVAAAFLEKKGEPPLETFSAVFPTVAKIDKRIDEREFIKEVEDDIMCTGNAVIADDFGPLLELDVMQRHADHLLGAPNVFMDWALFKAANKNGVQILLAALMGIPTCPMATRPWSRWLDDRKQLLEAFERMKSDPIKHESEAMLLNSAVGLSSWLSR